MAFDDTVISSARGTLFSTYSGNYLGEYGSLDTGYVSVVLTANITRNLPGGWPDWSFRFTDPIDAPYQGVLGDWNSGHALVYSTNPVYLHPLSGPFTIGTLGHLDEIITEHRGTFENFFMQDYTNGGDLFEDPLKGFVTARTTLATAQGNVGSTWNQHYLAFYPPKTARYMVPHFNLAAYANLKSQYLDAFQLEPNYAGAPTAWQQPRRIAVKVVPTRKNYSINPSFEVSNANLTLDTGITVTQDPNFAWKSNNSGKFSVANTVALTSRSSEAQYIDVLPGEYFAASFHSYVPATLTGKYQVQIRFYTEDLRFVSSFLSDAVIHDRTTSQTDWDLNFVVAEVPENATKVRFSHIRVAQVPTGTDVFYVDGVLLEKSPYIKDFFDGSFAGGDYLWNQLGTPGLATSYYYEDRVKRGYILTRTLSENVPLGVAVAAPQYALI